MKLCGVGCHPICDFCRFYRDYSEDEIDSEGYYGAGFCGLHREEVYASSYCDDFECFRLKESQ